MYTCVVRQDWGHLGTYEELSCAPLGSSFDHTGPAVHTPRVAHAGDDVTRTALAVGGCEPGRHATLSEYRCRAASPLVPTKAPMADHDIPDFRAALIASITCCSAADRSWTAVRKSATAWASSSSPGAGS